MAIDTKERILDVSERLFADFGYTATSLRDITSKAGVNLASVNYHFGSKEALLSALLERRFAPVNDRRLELLDTLEMSSGTGRPTVEEIVRAFVAPPFEMLSKTGEGGQKFLRLVGRIHSETDDIHAVFVTLFDPVMFRFRVAFQKALPQVDPDEVAWRTHFLIGAMAHTMCWCQSIASHGSHGFDPSQILESLVQFGAAGVATSTQQTIGIPAHMMGGRE